MGSSFPVEAMVRGHHVYTQGHFSKFLTWFIILFLWLLINPWKSLSENFPLYGICTHLPWWTYIDIYLYITHAIQKSIYCADCKAKQDCGVTTCVSRPHLSTYITFQESQEGEVLVCEWLWILTRVAKGLPYDSLWHFAGWIINIFKIYLHYMILQCTTLTQNHYVLVICTCTWAASNFINMLKDVWITCQKVCKQGSDDIIVKVNLQSLISHLQSHS